MIRENKKRELRGSWCMWASIQFLDEFPTPRKDMIEYLKWEFIIRPEYQKKYKTKQEVKAYNDWIQTAISMILIWATQLKDFNS